MEKGYKFIVDSREHRKTRYLVKTLRLPHEVQALTSGDYALRRMDPYTNLVGIERKTMQDLVGSISDQRLFTQIGKLSRQYNITYLMVSGSLDDVRTVMQKIGFRVNENVIFGTFASLSVRQGIQVMWFPDDRTLLRVAYRICEKVSEGKWNLPPRKGSKAEQLKPELFLERFPGITLQTAKKMLKRFGNLQNIANANANQLTVVPNVGDSKAKLIEEFFRREFS